MAKRAPAQILYLPLQASAPLSKKLRKTFTRALIDIQEIGKPFSKGDLAAFKCLVGIEAANVVKIPNPEFPQDTRHIKVDGKPFSWNRAIDGYDEIIYLKKAMRDIISLDLRDFLSAADPCECAFCGAVDDLTVDHAEIPFDTIASNFIERHGPIELDQTSSRVSGKFADMDIEAEWIAYHATNATYQVLCRSCNARKGKSLEAA